MRVAAQSPAVSHELDSIRAAFPLVATALVVLAGAAAASAQLYIQPVVSTGSQAPGLPAGTTLVQLGVPTVTPSGDLSYRSALAGAGVTSANNAVIVTADVANAGSARSVCRLGGTPAGLPAGVKVIGLDDAMVSAGGSALVMVTLGGTGITPSNNRALVRTDAAGNNRIIARLGDAAPGMPAGFTIKEIITPMLAPAGHLAFQVSFAGPNMFLGNNRGVYTMLASQSSPQLAARQNGAVAGQPSTVTWSSFAQPTLAPNGEIAFLGFMQGPGINAGNDAVVWSSSGRILARKGGGFGVSTLSYRSFSNPVAADGTFGFMAMLNDTASPRTQSGAFTTPSAGGGAYVTLERSGLRDNNMPAGSTVGLVGQPVIAQGGRFAVLGTVTGPGIATGSDIGLWAGGPSDPTTMIARTSEPIPGSGSVFIDAMDQPAVSASGHTVFTARLRGAGISTSNNTALFAYHPRVGLLTVAQTGRPVIVGAATVTPTEIAIARGTSGQDGRGTCITGSGTLVAMLRMGASEYIIRTLLPSSLADVTDAGGRGADGRVDAADMAAFMRAFAARSAAADVTGPMNGRRDGQVNAMDLQTFTNAYNTASATLP